MGILNELIRTILHFSCVAIDVVTLLVVARIIGQWRRIAWIERINDRRGKDIIDPFNSAVRRHWQALTAMQLTDRGALAMSLLVLCLARLLVCGLARLL